MTLPVEKSKPKENLWQYPIFLYGPPKIGKSTLVSEIPDVLFMNTGGGLDALSVYQMGISTWLEFLESCAEIMKGGHNFKVLAIDTVDRLHKMCVNHICVQNKISHPTDLSYGKGYDMVKDEFMRPLTKLAISDYGLILISHVREIEVSTRVSKYTKAVPTLQSHVWELIDGITAIILYMTSEITSEGERRVIKTAPSETYVAGDRT